MSNKVAIAAVGAILATGLTVGSTTAEAAEREKCYGVAKAGMNDCAGPGHACQGQSKVDGHKKEWLLVPKGLCEKLVNGSKKPG